MTFITAQELRKTYQTKAGPVHALDGLSLSAGQGTVRALLGPNGAGKTTSVKVLTTLLRPDSGSASVAGIDVLANPAGVRPLIGASGQYAAVDEVLTARENLILVGRLYQLGTRQAKQRAEELLEAFDLTDAADRPLQGFSGGMRRRVDLAGALVVNPPVLFLDEPTTGLDPQARIGLWEIIRRRVSEGTTLLLTTQYLEEADQLADAISVIDHGRVIAEGTADELKASVGGQRIELTLVDETDVDRARSVVALQATGEVSVAGRTVTAQAADPTSALVAVLAALRNEGIELHDAGIRRPTLDDVFLTLTGHGAKEVAA
ncbi:ATP-binding cassette domain-containing protein [Arachnia rubra]|jgi:daunorubicin resistance ABC transporter, ATP-binding protein|uniref:ATP-binding cassette domain-containing protein n=1 Tax=Arachnia rubra TaxID=1547448 RepID=A0ABX7Y7X9_9ACTN|nr:ATP-binding cassette domain-containing protein [Arachnia rubra]MBB1576350.1 ATP-binding cassette domain-containing protein [Propionibacterium sp.]MDO4645203.1 ATP-binding cassette domain-containing protein [Propionibacteriaceae bacterium]QUC09136.1 ATP-binding cassette domain-containing protein [Arachnia rubra]BCR80592.1 daunorubicin resistance protein DrrA family ABC transporter ATP-binding protein [Arachnia rubra]